MLTTSAPAVSTASRSGSAAACARAASRSALAATGSATATTRTPGIVEYASTCSPAIMPAPTTPTRSSRVTAQPLMPDTAMPWMNRRWKIAKITIIGSVAMTEPAKSRFHCVRFWITNSASPTGAV